MKKNRYLKLFVALILLVGAASARFQQTDDHIYHGVLDLSSNPNPEIEYGAYTIVQTGGSNLPVIYVITSNYKGNLSVLGAFRCDMEFTLQQSRTEGMRDILCVKQDVFGRKTATSLRYNKNGMYEEKY